MKFSALERTNYSCEGSQLIMKETKMEIKLNDQSITRQFPFSCLGAPECRVMVTPESIALRHNACMPCES